MTIAVAAREWRHPERRWVAYTQCKNNVNETKTTYNTENGHAWANVIQVASECWVYNFGDFFQRTDEVFLGNSPDVRLISEPKE